MKEKIITTSSTILYEKTREGAELFRREDTDIGFDLVMLGFRTNYEQDMEHKSITLMPGENAKILTGIRFLFPDDYYGVIMNRSSVASGHNLVVGAHLIDCGYTGEIIVDLHNIGSGGIVVEQGQRVAQIVFHKRPSFILRESANIDNYIEDETQRGSSGFGSTNKTGDR